MAEIEPDHLVYVDRRNNVLKLAQGEFVAVANLEAVFSAAPLVRQIFVYGNSERSYLLAVIVPTDEALAQFGDDAAALKAALRRIAAADRDSRRAAVLRGARRLPDRDRTVQRGQRLAFRGGQAAAAQAQRAYGARLEQLYAELAAAQVTSSAHCARRPQTSRCSTP